MEEEKKLKSRGSEKVISMVGRVRKGTAAPYLPETAPLKAVPPEIDFDEEECDGFCLVCEEIHDCPVFLDELQQEWMEELAAIREERSDALYLLTFDIKEGEAFFDFLENTLLKGFVKLEYTSKALVMTTNKRTVAQLIVEQLLEMDILFSLEVKRKHKKKGLGLF
jgi:hypothetical protein